MAISNIQLYQSNVDPNRRQVFLTSPKGQVNVFDVDQPTYSQLAGLGIQNQRMAGTSLQSAGGGQNYSLGGAETLAKLRELATSESDDPYFNFSTTNPAYAKNLAEITRNRDLFQNANFGSLPTTGGDVITKGVNDAQSIMARGESTFGGPAVLNASLAAKGLPQLNNTNPFGTPAAQLAQTQSLGRLLGPKEFEALRIENNVGPANFDQYFTRDGQGNIYLKPNAPPPTITSQNASGQNGGITATPNSSTNNTVQNGVTNTPSSEQSALFKELEKAQQQTPEEIQAQAQLDALIAQQSNLSSSTDLGLANIRDQAIPLQFLVGQGAGLLRQAAARQSALESQGVPLKTKLAALQAQRAGAMDVAKTKIGAEEAQYQRTQDALKNTAVKTPTPPTSVLEYEYAVRNGYTGTYQQYQNEDANRKRSISNTTVVTPQQFDQTLNTLNQSKGSDGFVNTDVYKKERATAKDKASFDKNYSYLLNPNDVSARAFLSADQLKNGSGFGDFQPVLD